MRNSCHTSRQIVLKENFEVEERSLPEDEKRFYKLFTESTFEGSRAAAQNMKKYAKRQTKDKQKYLLFFSLQFLISSNSEMLSWPNSPLLVMLQFVDPNVQMGGPGSSWTLLHHLAILADPSDYTTHVSQLILAKQHIEHGANVNAVTTPQSRTSLHEASKCPGCYGNDTVDTYPPVCSQCGQISADLAYYGRQYYHAIWSVLPGWG